MGIQFSKELINETCGLKYHEMPLRMLHRNNEMAQNTFREKVAIIPILRAGIGMVDGILEVLCWTRWTLP